MLDLKELKEQAGKYLILGFDTPKIIEAIDRAIAAEAKLAEIETQEPAITQYRYGSHAVGQELHWSEWGEKIIGKSGAFQTRHLYASKVQQSPAVEIPEDKIFPIDPRYENGEYYLLGSDVNELLCAAASPAAAISKMETTSPAVAVPDFSAIAESFEFENSHQEFEKYANAENLNMDIHPLHYLFIDPVTSAAKGAWLAAMTYAMDVMAKASAISTPIPSAEPKQRITEQDAREIVKSYIYSGESGAGAWFAEKGESILAKLNEHREPDYKAHRCEIVNSLLDIVALISMPFCVGLDNHTEFSLSQDKSRRLRNVDVAIKKTLKAIAKCEGGKQ